MPLLLHFTYIGIFYQIFIVRAANIWDFKLDKKNSLEKIKEWKKLSWLKCKIYFDWLPDFQVLYQRQKHSEPFLYENLSTIDHPKILNVACHRVNLWIVNVNHFLSFRLFCHLLKIPNYWFLEKSQWTIKWEKVESHCFILFLLEKIASAIKITEFFNVENAINCFKVYQGNLCLKV